jgi:phosphate butyryltransferase
MINNLKELLSAAQKTPPASISVAGAHETETLKAAIRAKELNIAVPILVGDMAWIMSTIEKLSANPKEFEIINEKDPARAAAAASDIVRQGRAAILMKGGVTTAVFLHTALGPPGELKAGLLSDVEVYEDDRRQGCKFVLVSDGGINISPGIRQKLDIIRNAVSVAHGLGIKRPRVALLSGSEKVHPDFQSTIDAVALVRMCQDGAVERCVVDGPFALDNAIDAESARLKGIESPVAGNADILIVPNLEAGNIFCKGLQYYGNRMLIHVAVGAKVPILIDSRTARADEKLHSMALAKIMHEAGKSR